MNVPARRQLMKRLITEDTCHGENKSLSCQTVEALRTAIDALGMLVVVLSVLTAVLPFLRNLSRLNLWLIGLVSLVGTYFRADRSD